MTTPFRLGLMAAIVALAADQASKAWVVARLSGQIVPAETVTDFFNLVLTANTGISFSFFAGARFGPLLLSLVAGAVIAGLVVALARAQSPLSGYGFGLIIGGAAGNLLDRARLGSVVDFLDVHLGGWHPFIFNGADAAISIGVGLLLLDGLLRPGVSPK